MSTKFFVPLDYFIVFVLRIIFQDLRIVQAEVFTINVSNCSSVLSDNSSLIPNCTITSSDIIRTQCTGSHSIKVWIAIDVETQIRCTHKKYMSVDAIFQNGTPMPSLRDSYIHQERYAENMSDTSTYTHVVKLNPKDVRIVKYSIREQNADNENTISVMILYTYWENITGWMLNNYTPETIFEAEQEVILVPCVDSGPHVPARLCIVEGPEDNETLSNIPIDNTKLTYDPSNGFYVNTTSFTNYSDHLYRCMEEHERVNDNGFDFRIVDLPDLKVIPVKQGNEVMRLFATKLVNIAPIHVQCNHKDPIRLEGTLTTNKVDNITWLLNFYTADELTDGRSRSKEIDKSPRVEYKTTKLPKVRHIANYRTGLKVFDELVINCISESTGQVLYNWTFVVHDAASGDTLSGNEYLHLTFPTRKIISDVTLAYEFQCYSETYNDVRLRSIRCSNLYQCALLEDCLNDNYRCGSVVTEGSPCPKSQLFPIRSCQQTKAQLPGQITVCTAGGSKFFQIHFVGFNNIIYNYYQRSGIDPSAIIQIETPEYEYFYTKGSFIFKCKVHQFFSEGQIHWAIVYNNGSEHDVNKIQEISRQNATDLVPHSQSSEIVFESSDVIGIVCYAPDISSSDEWFRSNLEIIEVQESMHPEILTEQTKSSFEKDAENRVIECQADGFPLPTIEWSRSGLKIDDLSRLIDGPNNTKILKFEIATVEIEGVYECMASNIVGTVRKEFTVSIIKDTKFLVGIISALMGLVVMLVPLLFLYRRYRLSKKPQIKMDETELNEFVNGLPEDQRNPGDPTQLPFPKEYEILKEEIEKIDKTKHLGGGTFGDVYLGKLKGNDDSFAFKMTKPNCPNEIFEALRMELKVMISLGRHVNIVALKGAYISEIKMGILYIVMEFCEYGSLESFIKKKDNYYGMSRPTQQSGDRYEAMHEVLGKRSFGFNDLLLWSEEIATGMEFLSKQKIVHMDVSTRNVLLNSNRTAKICDFGLSRSFYKKLNYVKTGNEPLPWRWMAIECLLEKTFSTESDVWAYGILLWEIFTLGDEPYPGVKWTNEFEFGNQLRMGLRNLKAEHATVEIDEMMRRCWTEEPQTRPGFPELKLFFSKLQNYVRVE